MVIHLGSELESALVETARRKGVPPEPLAPEALRERSLDPAAIQPRDDWERGLIESETDCGVSLPIRP